MTTTNEVVFSRLISLLPPPVRDGDKVRFIQTSASDKEWLKHAKVQEQHLILPNVKSFTLEFQGEGYFGLYGDMDGEPSAGLLEKRDINPGLLSLILAEVNAPVREGITSYDVLDKVMPFYVGCSTDYKGHEGTTIAELFTPIFVYAIDPTATIKNTDAARWACYFISKGGLKPSLPYTSITLQSIERLACEGHNQLPWPEILEALVAVRWETAFVSIYRCVEFLFCTASVRGLRDELCPTKDLITVSQCVEKHLDWRPLEENAMSQLFRNDSTIDFAPLRAIQMRVDGNTSSDLGRFVYRKLRNPIVHFRPAFSKLSLDDTSWDILIRSFLQITNSLYVSHISQPAVGRSHTEPCPG